MNLRIGDRAIDEQDLVATTNLAKTYNYTDGWLLNVPRTIINGRAPGWSIYLQQELEGASLMQKLGILNPQCEAISVDYNQEGRDFTVTGYLSRDMATLKRQNIFVIDHHWPLLPIPLKKPPDALEVLEPLLREILLLQQHQVSLTITSWKVCYYYLPESPLGFQLRLCPGDYQRADVFVKIPPTIVDYVPLIKLAVESLLVNTEPSRVGYDQPSRVGHDRMRQEITQKALRLLTQWQREDLPPPLPLLHLPLLPPPEDVLDKSLEERNKAFMIAVSPPMDYNQAATLINHVNLLDSRGIALQLSVVGGSDRLLKLIHAERLATYLVDFRRSAALLVAAYHQPSSKAFSWILQHDSRPDRNQATSYGLLTEEMIKTPKPSFVAIYVASSSGQTAR